MHARSLARSQGMDRPPPRRDDDDDDDNEKDVHNDSNRRLLSTFADDLRRFGLALGQKTATPVSSGGQEQPPALLPPLPTPPPPPHPPLSSSSASASSPRRQPAAPEDGPPAYAPPAGNGPSPPRPLVWPQLPAELSPAPSAPPQDDDDNGEEGPQAGRATEASAVAGPSWRYEGKKAESSDDDDDSERDEGRLRARGRCRRRIRQDSPPVPDVWASARAQNARKRNVFQAMGQMAEEERARPPAETRGGDRACEEEDDNHDHDEEEDTTDYDTDAELGHHSRTRGGYAEEEEEEEEEEEDDEEAEEQEEDDEDDGAYHSQNTVWQKEPDSDIEELPVAFDEDTAGPRIKPASIVHSFMAFLTDDMILEICDCTNDKAGAVYESRKARGVKKERFVCDPLEMKAFLGLLILLGAHKSNRVSYDQLWAKKYGLPVCHATMSLWRFKQFLRYIRFDTGPRNPDDKLAPVRRLWDQVNSHFQHHYAPTGHVTVDEQLVPYKGRVPFRQYMPSKTGKYGMKIFWMCDAKNYYPVKGLPYLGRGRPNKPGAGEPKKPDAGAGADAGGRPGTRNKTKGKTPPGLTALETVWELSAPIAQSGRNITMDNYFTSKELAVRLYEERALTLVGTLRSNKRCLPHEFKANATRPSGSTLYGFKDYLTLVSHVPARKKAVLLLTTKHHRRRTDRKSGKPETIEFYNETKCGVDTFDQLVKTYSCRRTTRRWPLAFFLNMLDAVCVASLVVWMYADPGWKANVKHRRRLFLTELGEGLVRPFIARKAARGAGPSGADRAAICLAGFEDCLPPQEAAEDADEEEEEEEEIGPARVRLIARYRTRRVCSLCPAGRRKRQRQCCSLCLNSVCDDHSRKTIKCHSCLGE